MTQKFRVSEDKCRSNKNKQTKKTHPEMEGVCSLSHQKEGRTKMEMTAPCIIVMHLHAEFLMLLMRVYRLQMVSQFMT